MTSTDTIALPYAPTVSHVALVGTHAESNGGDAFVAGDTLTLSFSTEDTNAVQVTICGNAVSKGENGKYTYGIRDTDQQTDDTPATYSITVTDVFGQSTTVTNTSAGAPAVLIGKVETIE